MSLLKVPVPWPPAGPPHALQVMPVTVMAPVAHPTVIFVGRVRDVDPGPQESTTGREVTLVVVRGAVVVDTFAVLVEPPMAADLFDWGEDLEPMLKPIAVPTPRAASTSATMPTRTTVLRCTVITGSLPTTESNGSSGVSGSVGTCHKMGETRSGFGLPRRRFLNKVRPRNSQRRNHPAARTVASRDEKPILASGSGPTRPDRQQGVGGNLQTSVEFNDKLEDGDRRFPGRAQSRSRLCGKS